jgi:hypothetical protein
VLRLSDVSPVEADVLEAIVTVKSSPGVTAMLLA